MGNDYKEFTKQLEERTRKFAVRIIRLSVKLPAIVEAKVIRNQIVRAGTSVGANYREANRSKSKADFKNKIRICEAEASETQYWLEVILDMKWLKKENMDLEFDECGQLLAIFASITKRINENLKLTNVKYGF